LREEYKICCQKLEDEQFLEWNLSLSNHLDLFLKTSTKQLDNLLLQLHQTTELIQNTFTIFGETIYPDHKTLEGEDMSVVFLGTVAKVVTLLANAKKDIERNTLSGDFKSPRDDEEGNTNGGRRRWSVTHTKSSRSIDQTLDNSPPPPPPPPKLQETISATSEFNFMTRSSPSPVLENLSSSSVVSPQSNSSPSSTPVPGDPSEANDTKSTKSFKDKSKGEKSNRSSRSKARIATL
jgi:hypothetical protein